MKMAEVPEKQKTDSAMEAASTRVAMTADSYPTARPWMMLVACPVWQARASDFTGSCEVCV